MVIFQYANTSNNWKCPICNTGSQEKVVLIPVTGTAKGNNMVARQYHIKCISLQEVKLPDNTKLLVMQFKEKGE